MNKQIISNIQEAFEIKEYCLTYSAILTKGECKLRKMKKKLNFDDFAVPEEHFNKMTEDIPTKYMDDSLNKLYMVRLWIRKNNIYAYKIGFTRESILTRIMKLNAEYDCCGRIIPVMVCSVKTSKSESNIHSELKEYMLNKDDRTINNRIHRELYNISPELYDNVNGLFRKNSKNGKIYESKRYIIGDDYGEIFDDYLINNEEETKFWHDRIFSDDT